MSSTIKAFNLGKRYQIGEIRNYNTLRDNLAESAGESIRKIKNIFSNKNRNTPSEKKAPEIWALKDINFEIDHGEVLGVIGPNGAGKSTLLKILSRITAPSEGRVEIHGRVGSLLEVGTGFHQELTGRENVYLSGCILGMKHSEIAQKFDAIVKFAGVEKFIDTPVKRYSSGMYLRLAFSVACHLETEILLVDEILAVGDVEFQRKCLGKIGEVARSGKTVLFVSHNMAAIRALCSKAIVLRQGKIAYQGDVQKAVDHYLTTTVEAGDNQASKVDLVQKKDRSGSGNIRVTSFESRLPGFGPAPLKTASPAEFVVGYKARLSEPITRLFVGISVMDEQGISLFFCCTEMYCSDFSKVDPVGKIICQIPNISLMSGRYWVTIIIKDDKGICDWIDKAASFEVIDDGGSGILKPISRKWGHIHVPHKWEWAPIA